MFFKSKPTPKPPRKLVFVPRQQDIRAREWRRNAELLSDAHAVVNDPRFSRMLTVLETESPANFAIATTVDLAQRAILQAKTEGYNLAINILLSLAKPIEDVEPLQETYEPDEPEFASENNQEQ